MVHDFIDGITCRQGVVGIPHVAIEVDPLRLDLSAVARQSRHGRAQLSCSRSRACAGVMMRAPMASMMVRAFSTSCALLAYTPLLKYRLSSKPTRTLPPSNTDWATHGICMRLMAKLPQLHSGGSEL